MYKRSTPYSEPTLFNSILNIASEKRAAILEDDHKWWNVFRREFTERIDEDLFSVLYCKDNGRPNAPIRQIVAMLILKELFRLSDEQLFEKVYVDLAFMISLGLLNLIDDLPCQRSYYNFCRRLREYEQEHGRDLIAEQFELLTSGQIKRYKVDGSEVRMDSKLFSSNIRRNTLYTLAVEVLQVYFKSLSEQDRNSIKDSTRRYLEKLAAKTPDQHAYQKTSAQIRSGLSTLGNISAYLLRHFKKSRAGRYDLLERFFNEHFEVKQSEEEPPPPAEPPTPPGSEAEQPELEGPPVELKHNESGSVLQSAHDEDATYRNKISGSKKQEVRGYVANITETCKPNQLNLITSVIVTPASTPDCDFFQPAIEQSERVSAQQIRKAFTDGAYHSPQNQDFINQNDRCIEWSRTAMQGQSLHFGFKWIEQDKELEVIELQTGQVYQAYRAKSEKEKYCIIINGQYRYFSRQQIDNYFLRQQIEANADESRKRRANVESTIHHTFYPLNGNKSKYRGMMRNKLFVFIRACCVNFKRVLKWIKGSLEPSETSRGGENASDEACFLAFLHLHTPQWLTWAMCRIFILAQGVISSEHKRDQILFACQRTS